ncbi:transglutaminase domain-containing protein [Candidatus Woesearchaeota archaeon]|nr:transglutaminase domain-containing protein [Candidatus Woesearchaeota archaeon]
MTPTKDPMLKEELRKKREREEFWELIKFNCKLYGVMGAMLAGLCVAGGYKSAPESDSRPTTEQRIEQSATPETNLQNYSTSLRPAAPAEPVVTPPKPTLVTPASPLPSAADKTSQDPLSRAVLEYLTQPTFTGTDFTQQVTGTKAELKRRNLDEGMAYFSLPANANYSETLGKLTRYPEKVESGQVEGNRLKLGNYLYSKPGWYFFRFPAADFKVDPGTVVKTDFDGVQYDITVAELADYLEGKNTYNGCLAMHLGAAAGNVPVVQANHGAFVAKKGEPSLERLVQKLTVGLTTPEQKAQRLLDFVTTKLKYNHSDALASAEVLKRPSEVLMTQGSDCSGLAILYASLLEQVGIDYRLVYSEDHVSVMVRGNFLNYNGLAFNLGSDTYHLAETTTKGFRIGSTVLIDGNHRPYTLDRFQELQKPGEPAYDLNGNKVPFLGCE